MIIKKIPSKYIIELGLIRLRNTCARCGNKMDIKNYYIQLYKKCRITELEKFTKAELKRIKKLQDDEVRR